MSAAIAATRPRPPPPSSSGEPRRRVRRRALGVAQHDRAQPVGARLELRGERLAREHRLRRELTSTRSMSVAPRADPGAREREAEVGEPAATLVEAAPPAAAAGWAREAAQRVVLEQHDPVVHRRRLAEALAARRAGRQRQARAARGSAGRPRASAGWRRRSSPNGTSAPRRAAIAQPVRHPQPERALVLADLHQPVEQLAEARVALAQPRELGVQRRREQRQLLIRREEAVAHDRGRRRLEVDGPSSAS